MYMYDQNMAEKVMRNKLIARLLFVFSSIF